MTCEPGVERTMQNLVWARWEGWSSTWHVDDILRTGCLLLRAGFGNGWKVAMPATMTLMEKLYINNIGLWVRHYFL